jgi:hypothetical protein
MYVPCPGCGRAIELGPDDIGLTVECVRCGQRFETKPASQGLRLKHPTSISLLPRRRLPTHLILSEKSRPAGAGMGTAPTRPVWSRWCSAVSPP